MNTRPTSSFSLDADTPFTFFPSSDSFFNFLLLMSSQNDCGGILYASTRRSPQGYGRFACTPTSHTGRRHHTLHFHVHINIYTHINLFFNVNKLLLLICVDIWGDNYCAVHTMCTHLHL